MANAGLSDYKKKKKKKNHDAEKDKSRKKRKRSEMTTNRINKRVKLKGIPSNILKVRHNAEMYLKCGEGPHKGYECFFKQLVTIKTIPKK